MTLKIYTASITYVLANGWPEDDEFIWCEPGRSVKQWMKKAAIDRPSEQGNPEVCTHRLDGPAAIWGPDRDPRNTWWVNGKQMLSYNRFQEATGCSDEDIIVFKLKYGSGGFPHAS
jgi:hypothetical protein